MIESEFRDDDKMDELHKMIGVGKSERVPTHDSHVPHARQDCVGHLERH